ncbi:MAG TPA: S41 family peptidase [Verrucomicrobiae bacterium]|nr:S41 family peptidase [Verrucomicrobiae bacterium]
MKFFSKMILGAAVLALLALPMAGRADVNTNDTPDFKEVYDLIRSHLAGESESELNRDAVQGLLQQLHAKVSLVNSESAPQQTSHALVLQKSALYDGPVGYLRVGRVGEGLANQLSSAVQGLEASNHLKGLVIDLRYADGHDYEQAVAVASLFVNKEMPLLDWGHGVVQSKPNSDPITLPVAVLINQQTAGAAEALAAMLRQEDRAVLIGSNTAGEATMTQEFPLKDGRYLRIATASVKLGNGETLANGVAPDISVPVRPEAERAYYQDPFKELPSSAGLIASLVGESAMNPTNGAITHPRQINEAELIRERKANPGAELDGSLAPTTDAQATAEKPVIHDPVLGRGLDLVKGISVMRHTHS